MNKLKKFLPYLGIGLLTFGDPTDYSQFLSQEIKTEGKRVFAGRFGNEDVMYREDVSFIDKNKDTLFCNVMWIKDKENENILVDMHDKTKISKNNSDELEIIVTKNGKKEIAKIYDRWSKNEDSGELFSKGNKNYNSLKNEIYNVLQNKQVFKFADKDLKTKGKEIYNQELQYGKVTYREEVPYTTIYGEDAFCNIMWVEYKKYENIFVDLINKTNLEKDNQKQDTLEIAIQKSLKGNEISTSINSAFNYDSSEKAQKMQDLSYFSEMYNEARKEILNLLH